MQSLKQAFIRRSLAFRLTSKSPQALSSPPPLASTLPLSQARIQRPALQFVSECQTPGGGRIGHLILTCRATDGTANDQSCRQIETEAAPITILGAEPTQKHVALTHTVALDRTACLQVGT
jgi:hypothetical protein